MLVLVIVLQSLFESQFEGIDTGDDDAFLIFDFISKQTFQKLDLQTLRRAET